MSRDAVMQQRFRTAQCFQFEITLEFDKNDKKIQANPHAEDWINAIPQHFETGLAHLTDMKCFLQDRLGRIHDDVGNVIFFQEDSYDSFDGSRSEEEGDLRYPDRQFRETYPEREVEHITFMLKRLFTVLEALLASVSKYEDIL